MKESRKSIKPIYPKHNELGYQIAFVQHTINRKLDPTLQEQIPRHTFETAIGFARWLLNQSISIHEELLEAEENDSFVAHFIKSSEHKGWMNARKIGRAYGKKRFKDTDAVREFMTKLIKMDLVDSKGTGAKLEISCHYQTPITVDRLTKLSKRIVDTDFQVSTEVVDKVDKISSDACTSEVAASTELVDKIRDGQQHDVQASSNDGRVNDTKYQRDDMSIDGDGNPILSTNNEIATTHIPIESHDILSILSTEAVDTLNLYSESVSNSFVNLSTENSKTDGQVPTKQDDPDPENGLPSGDAMESVKHPDEMERLQTLVIENDVVMEF